MYEVRIPTSRLAKILAPVYSRHMGMVCEWELIQSLKSFEELIQLVYDEEADYGECPIALRSPNKEILEALIRIIYN